MNSLVSSVIKKKKEDGPGAAGAAWVGGADAAGSPFRQLALAHTYGPNRLILLVHMDRFSSEIRRICFV